MRFTLLPRVHAKEPVNRYFESSEAIEKQTANAEKLGTEK